VDLVADRGAGRGEGCLADADAQATTSDKHRAAGKRRGVERAGHAHLTAATEGANEVCRQGDDGEPTRLVFAPTTHPSAEGHGHGVSLAPMSLPAASD
jgi:hypothetical protein